MGGAVVGPQSDRRRLDRPVLDDAQEAGLVDQPPAVSHGLPAVFHAVVVGSIALRVLDRDLRLVPLVDQKRPFGSH